MLDEGERGRRYAGFFEHLSGNAIDFGFEGGVEIVDSLGGRGHRQQGEQEQQKCGTETPPKQFHWFPSLPPSFDGLAAEARQVHGRMRTPIGAFPE